MRQLGGCKNKRNGANFSEYWILWSKVAGKQENCVLISVMRLNTQLIALKPRYLGIDAWFYLLLFCLSIFKVTELRQTP